MHVDGKLCVPYGLCGPDSKRESEDGDWFTAHVCENWEPKNEADNSSNGNKEHMTLLYPLSISFWPA